MFFIKKVTEYELLEFTHITNVTLLPQFLKTSCVDVVGQSTSYNRIGSLFTTKVVSKLPLPLLTDIKTGLRNLELCENKYAIDLNELNEKLNEKRDEWVIGSQEITPIFRFPITSIPFTFNHKGRQ